MSELWSKRFALFTLSLALVVVSMGAYTRLTQAGLGCPDWPGCYGHWLVPTHLAVAPEKAWVEMLHRFAAMALGVCIIVQAAYWLIRPRYEFVLVGTLLFALAFQATLGMLTVTWRLYPIVVMAHLLGGMTIVLLLSALVSRSRSSHWQLPMSRLWWGFGLCLVLIQITLGAWVSANYAGAACIGFPTCNGQWLPEWQSLRAAFALPVVATYEGGALSSAARVAIQECHRVGAMITLTYFTGLITVSYQRAPVIGQRILTWLVFLLLLQASLGIMSVIYLLPLSVALLHNIIAALILMTVGVLTYHTRPIADGVFNEYSSGI
jgi:heme a synthase